MDHEAYLDLMGAETVGRFDATPLFSDPETFETLRSNLLAGVAAGASVAGIVAVRVHHTERAESLFERYDVHSLG